MSRMTSPGWGSSTWTQTMDGKFCGNVTCRGKSANDGATYNGSVIRMPTPTLPSQQPDSNQTKCRHQHCAITATGQWSNQVPTPALRHHSNRTVIKPSADTSTAPSQQPDSDQTKCHQIIQKKHWLSFFAMWANMIEKVHIVRCHSWAQAVGVEVH